MTAGYLRDKHILYLSDVTLFFFKQLCVFEEFEGYRKVVETVPIFMIIVTITGLPLTEFIFQRQKASFFLRWDLMQLM